MKFKVKFDWILILTMILAVAVLFVPVILYFPSAISLLFIVFIALLIIGIAAFSYRITSDRLILHFGVFRWSFKLHDIKAIQPMKKPYRLKLLYGRNSYTILSVSNPSAFTAELRSKLGQK